MKNYIADAQAILFGIKKESVIFVHNPLKIQKNYDSKATVKCLNLVMN